MKTINPDGAAAMDGRIGISDRIVAVNGVNLTGATRQEVRHHVLMSLNPFTENLVFSQRRDIRYAYS